MDLLTVPRADTFCGWTTSLESVTTRAASVQYTFVFLKVKAQDILLPLPHGQLIWSRLRLRFCTKFARAE